MRKKILATRSIEVSFVIPALNAERTIRETVLSVQAQKYPADRVEILVVDNGSTDRTAFIARMAGAKVLHCRKPGPSAARNFGAKRAKGGYIAFLDADVSLDPLWLVTLLQKLKTAPYAVALGRVIPVGDRNFLNRFRQELGRVRYHGTNISVFNEDGTLAPAVNTAACIYKKAIFAKMGGFDENLLRAEDTELSTRLFLQGASIHASASAHAFVRYEYGPVQYLVRQFAIGKGLRILQKYKYWVPGAASAAFPNLIRETRRMAGANRAYYSCGLLMRYLGTLAPARAPKRQMANYYFPELENLLTGGFIFTIKSKQYFLGAKYRAISVDKKMFILTKQGKNCASIDLARPKQSVVKQMLRCGAIIHRGEV